MGYIFMWFGVSGFRSSVRPFNLNAFESESHMYMVNSVTKEEVLYRNSIGILGLSVQKGSSCFQH